MAFVPTTKRQYSKDYIDFSTLSKQGLVSLSRKWESAARAFENKIDQALGDPSLEPEKLTKLWQVGEKLWRRVATLERWRIRNKK